MWCAPEAFISWWNAPYFPLSSFIIIIIMVLFYLFIQFFIYLRNGNHPRGECKKLKVRSTQNINALGAHHIKGVFFFSRRLFEWDIGSFSFNHQIGKSCLQFNTKLRPLLLFYWIPIKIEKLRLFFWVGDGRYPTKFWNHYQPKHFMRDMRVKF